MIKSYSIKLGRTLVVVVNGKQKVIYFKTGVDYKTSDPGEQEAIEGTALFKSKFIELSETEPNANDESEKVIVETKEFPEVTDMNDAVKILKGAPYKINQAKLKSKEAVLTVANELGVLFPNLKVD